MAGGVRIKGLNQTIARMNKMLGEDNQKKIMAAGTEAMFYIGTASAAEVPVDTSFLLNSRFQEVHAARGRVYFKVGYSAAYAAAVHEMPGTLKGQPRKHFGKTSNRSAHGPVKPKEFGGGTGKGNYWDPAGKPHFLSDPFNEAVKDGTIRKIFVKHINPGGTE